MRRECLTITLHKYSAGYDKDDSNSVSISITWRLNQGKQQTSADKEIQLKDSGASIL